MIRVIKAAMLFVGLFMASLQASAQDVDNVGDTIFPTCGSAAADSDGDGFGFENNQSCIDACLISYCRLLAGAYPFLANHFQWRQLAETGISRF